MFVVAQRLVNESIWLIVHRWSALLIYWDNDLEYRNWLVRKGHLGWRWSTAAVIVRIRSMFALVLVALKSSLGALVVFCGPRINVSSSGVLRSLGYILWQTRWTTRAMTWKRGSGLLNSFFHGFAATLHLSLFRRTFLDHVLHEKCRTRCKGGESILCVTNTFTTWDWSTILCTVCSTTALREGCCRAVETSWSTTV